MKTIKLLFVLCVFLGGSTITTYGQEKGSGTSKVYAGFLTGYNRGYGIQANVGLTKVGNESPIELRVGLGYTFLNPGNALDARRIFINNNTNGTPEKSGRSIDYRLDFIFHKPIFGLQHSYLIVGPRGSSFKGNFAYIGGNEDFDVISNQWGLGVGLENRTSLSPKLNLVVAIGLDYYIPSTLTGHDTSYSPDNDNVNARNDNENDDEPFTYKDANEAISQPGFMPYAMLGLTLNL
ncbi:MAG: hypothetical protein U9R49_12835 [Bacteroidota bacterium]|nr:hypothetical protein [Bacteroidota bacterium]